MEGAGLESVDGYLYFGAAKNLPGVEEVVKKEAPAAPTISKNELMKAIDAEYLGM